MFPDPEPVSVRSGENRGFGLPRRSLICIDIKKQNKTKKKKQQQQQQQLIFILTNLGKVDCWATISITLRTCHSYAAYSAGDFYSKNQKKKKK